MIAVTKEEVEAIRKLFPYAHTVRTMKQKSKRHRYFCEEAKPVLRYLSKVRDVDLGVGMKGGGEHTNRKKTKRNSN